MQPPLWPGRVSRGFRIRVLVESAASGSQWLVSCSRKQPCRIRISSVASMSDYVAAEYLADLSKQPLLARISMLLLLVFRVVQAKPGKCVLQMMCVSRTGFTVIIYHESRVAITRQRLPALVIWSAGFPSAHRGRCCQGFSALPCPARRAQPLGVSPRPYQGPVFARDVESGVVELMGAPP